MERNVALVAEEIRRYLASRPDASDTVEGIAKWWITRQRLDESLVVVRMAVDQLVAAGHLSERRRLDGTSIYRHPVPRDACRENGKDN